MTAQIGRYPTALPEHDAPSVTPGTTATLDEHELIGHLDPELDLDCCKSECEQHADWYRRCRSCGALYPVCEHHHQAEMKWIADAMWVGCSQCSATAIGSHWTQVFEYVPIGEPS